MPPAAPTREPSTRTRELSARTPDGRPTARRVSRVPRALPVLGPPAGYALSAAPDRPGHVAFGCAESGTLHLAARAGAR